PGHPVISGVDLTVQQGERVALVGANGAGKSTLLKVIVGILRPMRGTATVFGEPPGASHRVAYLPQAEELHWDYPLVVEDVVLMARLHRLRRGRDAGADERAVARDALSRVDAADLARRPIGALSGGQKQRVLLGSLIVALVCAVVGVLVVLRGLAFLGDAVAHAAFPGIVIAFLLKTNLIIGGMVAAVLASVSMGVLSRRGTIREDTAIGVVFAGMFALGIVLFSRIRQFTGDLLGVLLGNVLAITNDQLVVGAITALFIVGVLRLWWRELIFVSFDSVGAAAAGLHVFRYDALLLALIGLTVAVAVQLVGIVLV